MAAFCSFPQVVGHEVVADVVAMGPAARGLEVGQRVVLNPWLSCGPRGVDLRAMLSHTFPLRHWREAFLAITKQGESGAVKVAVDQRDSR
jgi:threonine dehydrogenase-like Zn-dependent dehydrogenase